MITYANGGTIVGSVDQPVFRTYICVAQEMCRNAGVTIGPCRRREKTSNCHRGGYAYSKRGSQRAKALRTPFERIHKPYRLEGFG